MSARVIRYRPMRGHCRPGLHRITLVNTVQPCVTTLSVVITAAVATLPVVHFSTLSAAWKATAKTDKLMLSHSEGIYAAEALKTKMSATDD